jgi:hypothetical protein
MRKNASLSTLTSVACAQLGYLSTMRGKLRCKDGRSSYEFGAAVIAMKQYRHEYVQNRTAELHVVTAIC